MISLHAQNVDCVQSTDVVDLCIRLMTLRKSQIDVDGCITLTSLCRAQIARVAMSLVASYAVYLLLLAQVFSFFWNATSRRPPLGTRCTGYPF